MKTIVLFAALAALLSPTLFVTAASAGDGTSRQCGGGGFDDSDDSAKEHFLIEHGLLGAPAASISVYNGCYRVSYVKKGHNVTEYYDKDTGRPVD